MRLQTTWIMAVTIVASPALTYGADVSAATAKDPGVRIQNVELTRAGALEAQLLTNAGQPVSRATIKVRSQADVRRIGQQVTTDSEGRFLVTGLRNGTCVVESDNNAYAVRVWQHGMAPPKSLQTVAFVRSADGETVRGQDCGDAGPGSQCANRIRCMSTQQKILIGVLVAAAISIPIALQDDKAQANGS